MNKTRINRTKKNLEPKYAKIIKSTVISLLFTLMVLSIFWPVLAVPAGPSSINYISNTTAAASTNNNRTIDIKGTITTVVMNLNQQDYKWKAYVGNITGGLTLADATGKSIYDWSPANITGEVFVTRYSNTVNWGSVSCVNQSVIDNEQSAMGMSPGVVDNINNTFNGTTHKNFLVGTINVTANSCRSIATNINGAAQSAFFQEILLKDNVTSSLIYTGMIDSKHAGYNNANYDFQMIVGENESSSNPTPYYFYVELR